MSRLIMNFRAYGWNLVARPRFAGFWTRCEAITGLSSVLDTRRLYATSLDTATLLKKLDRFWENANIETNENGHAVRLGSKTIKTSGGNPIIVPASKLVLANLIIQEWATLPNLQIKPHSLPLTSITARAIDLAQLEPAERESTREAIIESLLPYLDTDTMLIFAPTSEYEGALRKDQETQYRPHIEWAEMEIFDGHSLVFSDGDEGLMANRQTEQVKEKARNWARGLSEFQLAAFERAVLGAKSFIGGMRLVLQEISTSELAEAVSLEVTHQMRRWGEVEDSHDVDWADLRRQLASAAVLVIED
ncbi:uncharacterized protein V1516DRAFT_672427 [Lipomyces oligophaga]|uniref:uncharacterized protein n=1 Tax=Lipomyces oligophaga TaxID=45792 RepID=UPI0034CE24AA